MISRTDSFSQLYHIFTLSDRFILKTKSFSRRLICDAMPQWCCWS